MNGFRIKIIIVTMALALIGLVGLQLYWIRGAIEVRESYFYANVNEAVSNVIYKLEKLEVARQLNDPKAGASPLLLIDSLNREIIKKMEAESNRLTNNLNIDSTIDIHGKVSVEFFGRSKPKQNTNSDTNLAPLYSEFGTKSIELTQDQNKQNAN